LPSTLTVLNNQNSGPGSLRDTIAAAANGDTIDFDPSLAGQTITLTSGPLLLNKNLDIEGPGADVLAVSGNHASAVFQVASARTVSLSGLTIENGRGANGGGIYNQGTLTVQDSAITNNTAAAFQAFGGGIANVGGTLTVVHCTLSGNDGGMDAGAIFTSGPATIRDSTIAGNMAYFAGGIEARLGVITHPRLIITSSTIAGNTGMGDIGGLSTAIATTISNSTFANNTAMGEGVDTTAGGISSTLSLEISNSTISGNSTAHGGAGGIRQQGGAFTFTMRNTIVAGNSSVSGVPDLSGSLTSSGYNLIGSRQGGSGFDPTDLLNVDPLLGPLQDNGGPTQTMALLGGSPALNTGDPAQLGVADQRGVVRRGAVNIGAYQASASALVVSAPDTAQAGVPFDVTVTAVDPYGQVALGYTGTVTFSTTDPDSGVVLPPDYTFTSADEGSVTFGGGVTLITPGTQMLTVTDIADNTIAGGVTMTVASGGGNWTDLFWRSESC
jgi:hypothetical protein